MHEITPPSTAERQDANPPRNLTELLEENALPSLEVKTPIGPIQVYLAGPNELISPPIQNSPEWQEAMERLSGFTSEGILAEYLCNYGKDKGPVQELDARGQTAISKVEPVRMVITNYLVNASGLLFMAYVDICYRQQQTDGSWQTVEVKVHFRPDSATTLVEIISESGKRFIMLNIVWKEGVGGVNYGEASAGSLDHGKERKVDLALREVNEEIGLTLDEIAGATVKEVFTDKTVSPGGYSERMSGYHLTLTLSDERIQELLNRIHGADANEHIINQLIPIELPEVPKQLTNEYLTEFNLAWEKIVAATDDLKTQTLILEMRIEELNRILRKILSNNQLN